METIQVVLDEKLLKAADDVDARFEKKGMVFRDAKADEYLNGIAAKLLNGTPVPERVRFQFRLLRDPMINAFALPNGSIYVNSGLVAAMHNEAELASVLAHEITHVTNRHTYIQARSLRKKVVALDVLAVIAAGGGYFGGPRFGLSVEVAAQVSQVLIFASVYGFSRELETDADKAGYQRLVRSKYDGAAMERSFQTLDEKIEYEPLEPFWRTHPKLKERIAMAKKLNAEENAVEARVVRDEDYLENMSGVIRYNISLDLESRRARTAAARAERLETWRPADPSNKTLLADAFRSLGAKTPNPDEREQTKEGKEYVRKEVLKRTAQEEEKDLESSPLGLAALAANRKKAEAIYTETIATEPNFAEAHRGLGMLYQDEGRVEEAAREYRRYLELAPAQAADRLRIERRLEALTKARAGSEEK